VYEANFGIWVFHFHFKSKTVMTLTNAEGPFKGISETAPLAPNKTSAAIHYQVPRLTDRKGEGGDCFNYVKLSQVTLLRVASPPSLLMKLAHPAYLTFPH
jgi:hypothetical protein